MPNVLPVYLIDTNVFIYAVTDQDPPKPERALAILDKIVTNEIGSVSTQILNETFSWLTRGERDERKSKEAESIVHTIVSHYEVFDTTVETTLEAVRGASQYQLQIWDSLLWAAAKLNGVPYVLSEDFSHGQTLEGVTFLNPFDDDFVLEGQRT